MTSPDFPAPPTETYFPSFGLERDAALAAVYDSERRGVFRAAHRLQLAVHHRERIPVGKVGQRDGLRHRNRPGQPARPRLIDREDS